jgi:hypothetical protein
MSVFINIRVTEAELDLITCLLEQAGTMEDSTGQPAFELLHDLMEQAARPDEWNDPEDPDLFMDPVDFQAKHDTDLVGFTFTVAEDQFINAGIAAREHLKASGSPPRDKEVGTSRAAMRRNTTLKGPRGHYDPDVFMTATERLEKYAAIKEDDQLSETQRFDLWDDSDPKNW